jgi:hypothetical protein
LPEPRSSAAPNFEGQRSLVVRASNFIARASTLVFMEAAIRRQIALTAPQTAQLYGWPNGTPAATVCNR